MNASWLPRFSPIFQKRSGIASDISMLLCEQMIEQRGLTSAQKAGEHRDGNRFCQFRAPASLTELSGLFLSHCSDDFRKAGRVARVKLAARLATASSEHQELAARNLIL